MVAVEKRRGRYPTVGDSSPQIVTTITEKATITFPRPVPRHLSERWRWGSTPQWAADHLFGAAAVVVATYNLSNTLRGRFPR